MQKEWNLSQLPAGPFSAKQTALIPLADLPELLEQNQVKVLNQHQLVWFCKQKESFLSQEINGLNQQIQVLGQEREKLRQTSLSEFNLLASNRLSKNLDFLYLTVFKESVSQLLTYIPTHLQAVNSKFYLPRLSQTIKVIQTQTINAFKKFASEEGSKFIHSNNYQTFIKSDSALDLARTFSQKQHIPAPAIKARHRLKAFG